MECAQLQITGGGSTSPATVNFPGAYSGKCSLNRLTFLVLRFKKIGSDPGIKINIYQTLTSYTVPGTTFLAYFSTEYLKNYRTSRLQLQRPNESHNGSPRNHYCNYSPSFRHYNCSLRYCLAIRPVWWANVSRVLSSQKEL